MRTLLLILLMMAGGSMMAQQFVNSGEIEYEVISNNHKRMGDEENPFTEMFKEKMPKLSKKYYKLTFSGNKTVYKYDRQDESTKQLWDDGSWQTNIWYADLDDNTSTQYKFVVDNNYLLSGSLMNVEWKLSPSENRIIAGFNCRKATGVLFDSVYVFAFYTDEIVTSGGPMSLHGLPGMILGVTIPRMFTSWVATKLSVTNIDTKLVVAPTKGKKKDPEELKKTLRTALKGWGSTWMQQQLWDTEL